MRRAGAGGRRASSSRAAGRATRLRARRSWRPDAGLALDGGRRLHAEPVRFRRFARGHRGNSNRVVGFATRGGVDRSAGFLLPAAGFHIRDRRPERRWTRRPSRAGAESPASAWPWGEPRFPGKVPVPPDNRTGVVSARGSQISLRDVPGASASEAAVVPVPRPQRRRRSTPSTARTPRRSPAGPAGSSAPAETARMWCRRCSSSCGTSCRGSTARPRSRPGFTRSPCASSRTGDGAGAGGRG